MLQIRLLDCSRAQFKVAFPFQPIAVDDSAALFGTMAILLRERGGAFIVGIDWTDGGGGHWACVENATSTELTLHDGIVETLRLSDWGSAWTIGSVHHVTARPSVSHTPTLAFHATDVDDSAPKRAHDLAERERQRVEHAKEEIERYFLVMFGTSSGGAAAGGAGGSGAAS